MRLPVLNKNRKKILSNISWLSFDTAVKMIVGLLVGIWTARYLQPQNYGLLNYSTSFVLFFSFFLYLSYDDLVIKKLVTRSKPRIQSVLGAAFLLKMLGGVIATRQAGEISKESAQAGLILRHSLAFAGAEP